MILSYIWVAFICLSFLVATYRYAFEQNTYIFHVMANDMFQNATVAVMDIALPLIGIMAFWLGLMKIAEKTKLIEKFARVLYPFFSTLFPDLPKNHPAVGHMTMNFSANLLGLDNAATPFGLKAMQSLQEVNPNKTTASRPQIMFILLHASGLTMIPVSVMAQRAIYGAANPSDVFIPMAISTTFTTLVSLLMTSWWQKIHLPIKFLLKLWLLMMGLASFVFIMYAVSHLQETEVSNFIQTLPSVEKLSEWTTQDWKAAIPDFEHYIGEKVPPLQVSEVNTFLHTYTNEKKGHLNLLLGNVLLLLIPVVLVIYGLIKKRNVFSDFVEGAKESFNISLKIIPYLVGLLVAIGLLRSSGIIDIIVSAISSLIGLFTTNVDFVPALSTALMKPLSGSGARVMMIETMKTYGADSFVGKLSCIFQGTSDTILYVVALYFGSVGIGKTGHTILLGLFIDFIGIIGAIFVGYWFFA